MPIGLGTPSSGGGGGGSGTVTNVSSANTAIAVATPTTTPVLTLATLDVIAADGPPAAAVAMNAQKITGLANGSAASDAAAYGQVVHTVAATDTSIVVGGTATAPTIATGTLDVIAADHPPAADWSNNSHKITSLANGSGAQDAAAYGQTIAGGATPGAGGDLTGTYPNPTVAAGKITLQKLSIYPVVDLMISGAKAETIPRWAVSDAGGLALVSQQVFATAIQIPNGTVITSISWVSGTTALATGVNQVFGLYSSALNLLAHTTDDTSTAWAASTIKTLNLTPGTYTTTTDGPFYLAVLVNATTAPTIAAIATVAPALLLSQAPVIQGRYDTGRTTLPATITYATSPSKIAFGYVS